ncbi:MAG: extracellular solute-binding protein [Planctomycetota bacterium]|nr:MAG: extracellular solute-binding protein [Planctomycetota bacterium]
MAALLPLFLPLLAPPTAGDPPREPAETVLRVLVHERWFAGWKYLQATAREFEAAHPGVRVEVLSSAGATGGAEKVKLVLAGGLPLDVTWIDVTEFAAWLREDVLLDLQPFFDADPTWRREDYFEPILQGMTGPDGNLYGLPSTFTPYVIYVNQTILRRAGVAPPRPDWTWDDLLAKCRATTRDLDGDGAPDQFGISLTQWMQALAPWIWQNGGRFLDENGRCALDEPEAVEAVEFLIRLLHEEKVASDDATFQNQLATGLFQAGRTAFYGPVGFWETYRFQHIPTEAEGGFDWDVVPLPRRRQAATSVALRFYVVPKVSRHPQLAYEFVRALAGDTMQRGLAAIGNGVPGLKRAAFSSAFLDPERPPASEQVFLDVLPTARFLPVTVDWTEIEKATQAVLEEAILLGRIPAREACERAAAIADRALARTEDLQRRPFVGAGWFSAAQLAGGLAVLALAAALLGRRRPRLARREARAAWLFLAPWAIGLGAFLLGPALVSALLSLSEWSPIQDLGRARWMGLDQYRRLLADGTFHDSLRVTFGYAALAVPLQLLTALGLALAANGAFRGAGALRTIFYLPTVISPVILGALWRQLLEPWLKDPATVLPAFVVMGLWTTGAQMLVFLAGLQAVDPRLHEAARVDGAGPLRRLWHVTLPALGPVVLLNLVVGLLNAFQLFAQPFVMTQGGPGNASRFLALYLYEQGFRFLRMGYASTLAWVLFGAVFVLTLAVLRGSRRFVHYAGAGR